MSSDHANDFSTYQKETRYYFGKSDRYRVKKQLVTTTEDGQEIRGMEEDASALDRCAIDFFAGLKDEQTRPRNSTFPKSLKNDTGDGNNMAEYSHGLASRDSMTKAQRLWQAPKHLLLSHDRRLYRRPASIITRVQSNGRPRNHPSSRIATDYSRSDFKYRFEARWRRTRLISFATLYPILRIRQLTWSIHLVHDCEEMYPSSIDS